MRQADLRCHFCFSPLYRNIPTDFTFSPFPRVSVASVPLPPPTFFHIRPQLRMIFLPAPLYCTVRYLRVPLFINASLPAQRYIVLPFRLRSSAPRVLFGRGSRVFFIHTPLGTFANHWPEFLFLVSALWVLCYPYNGCRSDRFLPQHPSSIIAVVVSQTKTITSPKPLLPSTFSSRC